MPSFNIEVKGIKEALARIDSKKVQRAAVSALRRVAMSGRTEVSSAVRDVYNIKKRDLDKRITVSPINKYNLSATLRVAGGGKMISEGKGKDTVGVSLAYFGAKQIKGTKQMTTVRAHQRTGMLFGKTVKTFAIPQYQRRIQKGGGVSAKIFISGQRTTVRGAFLATMKSGHVGVMRRRTTQRMTSQPNKFAIQERRMVSLPTIFHNTRALERLRARVLEQWPKEFEHNLERELAKR